MQAEKSSIEAVEVALLATKVDVSNSKLVAGELTRTEQSTTETPGTVSADFSDTGNMVTTVMCAAAPESMQDITRRLEDSLRDLAEANRTIVDLKSQRYLLIESTERVERVERVERAERVERVDKGAGNALEGPAINKTNNIDLEGADSLITAILDSIKVMESFGIGNLDSLDTAVPLDVATHDFKETKIEEVVKTQTSKSNKKKKGKGGPDKAVSSPIAEADFRIRVTENQPLQRTQDQNQSRIPANLAAEFKLRFGSLAAKQAQQLADLDAMRALVKSSSENKLTAEKRANEVSIVLDQRDQEMASLKSQILLLTESIEKTVGSATESADQISLLKCQLLDEAAKSNKLADELSLHTLQVGCTQEQMEALSNSLFEKDQSVIFLSKSIAEKDQALTTTRSELDAIQILLQEKLNEVDFLKKSQSALQTSLHEESEKCKSLEYQLVEIHSDKASLSQSTMQYELKMQEIEKEMTEFKESLSHSNREKEQALENYSQVLEKCKSLEVQGENVAKTMAVLRISVAQLELEKSDLISKFSDIEKSQNTIAQVEAAADTEIVTLKAKLETAIEIAALEAKTHLDRIEESKKLLEAACAERDNLKALFENKSKVLLLAQEEAANVRTEREGIRKKMLELEGTIECYEREKMNTSFHSIDEVEQSLAAKNAALERCKALTTQLAGIQEDLSKSEKERKDLLSKVSFLEADVVKLQATIQSLEKQAALAAEAEAEALGRAQKICKGLEIERDEREKQLIDQRAESDRQLEAHNDKLKRLKTLLSKTRDAMQEREATIAKMNVSKAPPKSMHVLVRVEAADQFWCLVVDERTVENQDDSECESRKPRWISQDLYEQWTSQDGTTVTNYPEQTLNDIWDHKNALMVRKYEDEKNVFLAEVADANEKFAAYKSRAAIALKRLGQEERESKRKEKSEEAKQIDELSEKVGELENNIVQLTAELEASKESTSSSTFRLQKALSETQQISAQLEETNKYLGESRLLLGEQSERIKELEGKIAETNSQKDAEIRSCLSEISSLKDSRSLSSFEDLSRVVGVVDSDFSKNSSSSSSLKPSGGSASNLRVFSGGDDVLEFESNLDVRKLIQVDSSSDFVNEMEAELQRTKKMYADLLKKFETEKSSTSNIDDGHSTLSSKGPSGSAKSFLNAVEDNSSSGQIGYVKGVGRTDGRNEGRTMLLQQTEGNLIVTLNILREENANLMVEMSDYKHTIALSAEQTVALKENIRELQAELDREKEFNSSSRRLNAEYLVNVLQKFLLSDNPKEKEKLVPVICSILHFNPEETSKITDKHTVKRRGLFGWLPPAPVAPPSDTVIYEADGVTPKAAPLYDPYSDALGPISGGY